MKPETFTPGEQTANPIDHAATGIRVRVYHKSGCAGAPTASPRLPNWPRTSPWSLRATKRTRVQWTSTGTLHALLEVIRMASMDLHGMLSYVLGEDGQ
ncbi:MAG: hypothetical protein MZV65_02555 [Chromatiales bacterium]|nr:hypothetical protein [Chromatiales bacterium]